MDGYLSGKTGDTTINLELIEDLGKSLGTECRKNPQAKVLDVVQRVTQ
ncbi:MAG: hypothetical protein FJZ47_17215 [Candidatus Tectomicrobia bacterium]|uniref:Uncharacterized protein n=1 Tax=Tectimicrobiota bacterium TaxID=2528274 RepID=A0A937W5E7_UNCTE|nr:hypothetical protein [Candidatus Tectomicrobia bacterium]